jgi:hypothetical protein
MSYCWLLSEVRKSSQPLRSPSLKFPTNPNERDGTLFKYTTDGIHDASSCSLPRSQKPDLR